MYEPTNKKSLRVLQQSTRDDVINLEKDRHSKIKRMYEEGMELLARA